MSTATQELLANREYKYGFTTDIETETIAKGLSRKMSCAYFIERKTNRNGFWNFV